MMTDNDDDITNDNSDMMRKTIMALTMLIVTDNYDSKNDGIKPF
jgi:hypothetical protein